MKTLLTAALTLTLCACGRSQSPPGSLATPTPSPSFGTPAPGTSATSPPNVPPGVRPTPTPKPVASPRPTPTPSPFNGGALTVVIAPGDAPRVTEAFQYTLKLSHPPSDAEIEDAMAAWVNATTGDYERRKNMRDFSPPPLGGDSFKRALASPTP